ncbi:protein IQ-DOMAIN 1-like [Herrania umbratica]|uniref:Protein IQ-DOMAIN 1-like n=1 Tax=Herrania umbratica TaxID=108875 RepID=A0A6J1ASG3_9ROSI|nr:protein IQ-DOMAIN 1-like [Herrania umbratica]XP_021290137.1 protein IQ-DOMAIN 1-like [Herrania umbratica]
MGKKAASSWLSMVKKALRSPAKDNEKKSSRRRDECDQEEEEKKREKRRWLFRRPSNINHVQQWEAKTTTEATCSTTTPVNSALDVADQRHAIAVAAAAEAAVATTQAAVEIVRLSSKPSNHTNVREHYAAVVIQTAFRGYLARRALHALKGLVKLQALVRGHNVRRQAKLALKCMQSLVRVQDREIDQQSARLSHEGCRKSMFAETNAFWESRYLQDIRSRKSMSRDMSCTTDEWDDRPQTSEEIEAILQNKKEAALKREKALAYAFSKQIWRSGRNPSAGDEKELEERTKWLDRWMATKQWESNSRVSTDKRDSIKTVEIDTYKPQSYSSPTIRKSQYQNHKQFPTSHSVASPMDREHHNFSLNQYPATPYRCKTKPLQVRSASPRCLKEEKSYYSAANTPSLASTYCTHNGISRYGNAAATVPNYMAATESAKAKARSQSTPKQRPSTPERERGGSLAKKRLSYPASESHVGIGRSSYSQNLRSPSFKSAFEGHYGMEKESFFSSYYTESLGGEISPCSTTDLRWLK